MRLDIVLDFGYPDIVIWHKSCLAGFKGCITVKMLKTQHISFVECILFTKIGFTMWLIYTGYVLIEFRDISLLR